MSNDRWMAPVGKPQPRWASAPVGISGLRRLEEETKNAESGYSRRFSVRCWALVFRAKREPCPVRQLRLQDLEVVHTIDDRPRLRGSFRFERLEISPPDDLQVDFCRSVSSIPITFQRQEFGNGRAVGSRRSGPTVRCPCSRSQRHHLTGPPE